MLGWVGAVATGSGGLSLILDFVPNHTALDHPWVSEHPEFYVRGSEDDLAREPQNYFRDDTGAVLAYGRDPNFAGWPDTLQLDYGNPALQAAMRAELGEAVARCDGVRCDMAMLVLPEVFERTWGRVAGPFWPGAIAAIKGDRPGFLFIAEVYWDLQWQLQQQGFDFTYDKRLYDRLVEGHVPQVRGHLFADLDFQEHSARFLESHDEPRAAVTFAPAKHRAAAIVTFLSPGLRFFHQGQLEGARTRHPGLHEGTWTLIDARAAWDGNWTHEDFLVQGWRGDRGDRLVAIVNFADHPSQCYISPPFSDLAGRRWILGDLLSDVTYSRDGDGLAEAGLYLDMPGWGYHVFEVVPSA